MLDLTEIYTIVPRIPDVIIGHADFMLEVVQLIARVVGAISSTGLFVLRLLERFEHKKSNRSEPR